MLTAGKENVLRTRLIAFGGKLALPFTNASAFVHLLSGLTEV